VLALGVTPVKMSIVVNQTSLRQAIGASICEVGRLLRFWRAPLQLQTDLVKQLAIGPTVG
jgi:hypothetical protein